MIIMSKGDDRDILSFKVTYDFRCKYDKLLYLNRRISNILHSDIEHKISINCVIWPNMPNPDINITIQIVPLIPSDITKNIYNKLDMLMANNSDGNVVRYIDYSKRHYDCFILGNNKLKKSARCMC